jgi:anaerobic selenocysteine-containing dehydrogenase
MRPLAPPRSWIERTAERLGLIPALTAGAPRDPTRAVVPLPLARYPSAEQWDDFVEFDAAGGSKRLRPRRYRLVPTTCFNCEAACGLLAYVDKESSAIRKLEGNPLHPASRGRNCAKGPATLNQVTDPDRILHPMKRAGPRGSGQWKQVGWDEVLADVGGRIRRALQEQRRDEIVYHVGRPGAEGFIDRVLRAWGVDGHNSHTNICSSGARLGYALTWGYDRPSPDYANARFILALNAHLESGHYFNPMAQRISEGLAQGAKLAVVDPRLSNTASMATFWLPCKPGTEAALLLALAGVILNERLYDRNFIERWVNWREFLAFVQTWRDPAAGAEPTSAPHPPVATAPPGAGPVKPPLTRFKTLVSSSAGNPTVDDFIAALAQLYADFTPEYAERECGIPAPTIVRVARLIGQAGTKFCSHTWRGAASAHLGGWQVSRCLMLLHMLTGSAGTEGGCLPAGWQKYKASLLDVPPPQSHWNELHWPREFPLAHYEMSFLLPHFLKDGRGRIDTYFTRVFNPVWTYPDGFTWMDVLRDESRIGLHVALTPTWNETALFADYVLPMGHGPERHDLNTYETHSGTWIAFRQPVLRAHARAEGRAVRDTRDVNPGEVWEEDEFWIALCWAIDPDGALGVRKYFESRRTPGQMLTVDEYYQHLLDRVPGLPHAAQQAGLSTLDYMRKFGAFEIKKREYLRHERPLAQSDLAGAAVDSHTGVFTKNGAAVGVSIDDGTTIVEGFATPSRRIEFYSPTLVEWGWPEFSVPGYILSHIYEPVAPPVGDAPAGDTRRGPRATEPAPGRTGSRLECCLLPTFRLPTLIHTRSGSAKWLNEISQHNPIWMHTTDARRIGVRTGNLARVSTRIGYFVDRVWVTEGLRPGVVACSHHLGRWRRPADPHNSRWSGSVVSVVEVGPQQWKMRIIEGPRPFESPDPDSRRIWWRDGGVPQNLTFPVQPDPISGMHCWHQRVTVERAAPDEQCGDVFVDTRRSMEIYRDWMARTRWPVGPAPGADGKRLRRPLWLNRPLRPAEAAFRV